jgi:uncharacterized protein YacL
VKEIAEEAAVAPPPERRSGAVPVKPFWAVFTGVLSVIGGFLGCLAGRTYVAPLYETSPEQQAVMGFVSVAAFTVVGGLLGFLLSSATFRKLQQIVPRIEEMAVEDKIAGIIGVIIGLVVVSLLKPLYADIRMDSLRAVVGLLVYATAVTLGAVVTLSMKKELFSMLRAGTVNVEEEPPPPAARTKLLDTNIIIEGRILEVYRTGFIEGPLLIPQFVLDELHQIADSADNLRRQRGRRGLDILNQMREVTATLAVLSPPYEVDVDDAEGVDGKLVKLAVGLDASILTNDFNLTKVAELQGVPVLNVNKLATALKPVVLPGEQMTVTILKEGKDMDQGVAYLDDGTMVVVENGRRHIGDVVDVTVSSVLQTAAGKMIFANVKGRTAGYRSR